MADFQHDARTGFPHDARTGEDSSTAQPGESPSSEGPTMTVARLLANPRRTRRA